MSQSRPPFHVPTLLIVIVFAILTGAGGWLIFNYLKDRPETPPGVSTVTIDGVAIRIEAEPAKEVLLVPDPAVAGPTITPQTIIPAPAVVITATAVSPPPPPPPPPPPSPTPQKIIHITYTVGPNDTLYSISAGRMDTSIALMAEHGIAADHLIPGQPIQLPIGNPAYCTSKNGFPYAVREGDTAFSVSNKCGTSVDVLRSMNNLNDNYLIRVADIICVPNVAK